MSKAPRTKTSRFEANLWMGMDFFAWMRLLVRNRFAISPSRLPFALLITLFSVANTALRWLQKLFYGAAVGKVELPGRPCVYCRPLAHGDDDVARIDGARS